MSVLKNFEKIQRIFYFAGVAPFRLNFINQKQRTVFRSIPILISFLSNMYIVSVQFYKYYLDEYGMISRLINYAYFTCATLANVTANFQCFFYESTYRNIIRSIEQLEIQCNYKFSRKISSKSIRRYYMINAMLIIGCFSISTAMVLGQAWFISLNPMDATVTAFLTTFKEFTSALTVLHFTMYVDIVRLFIVELNKHIIGSPICFYVSTKIALLKYVKLLHMETVLLIKKINNFFGWHLLVLMTHYLILITYSVYWLYLTVRVKGESFLYAGGLLYFPFFQKLQVPSGSTNYFLHFNTRYPRNYERFSSCGWGNRLWLLKEILPIVTLNIAFFYLFTVALKLEWFISKFQNLCSRLATASSVC